MNPIPPAHSAHERPIWAMWDNAFAQQKVVVKTRCTLVSTGLKAFLFKIIKTVGTEVVATPRVDVLVPQ